MNKKNWKNETKQQTRKREFRPVSRDSASTRRNVRAPESGINFMVNVSSSGTNLNKQIEWELARLDSVEKKIRKHKCKATSVTSNKPPTTNISNQRKLRNILESMLATIDYVPPKSKKYTPYHQKVRLVENDCADTVVRRCVKPRKNPQNPRRVESFTNFITNNNKRVLKSNVPKTDTIFVKTPMKKPMSAPSANHNRVFADDLRFAESLRCGKNIDLHFMLTDMKKMIQSSSNNFSQGSNNELRLQKNSKNVKFSSEPKKFKVIIEKPSKNNISYIYDSSSIDCMNVESLSVDGSKWPNEPIRPLKKISSYDSGVKLEKDIPSENTSKEVDQENKVVKEEPEEKEFYSYLRRGNFIISGRMDENNNEDSREQNCKGDSEEIVSGHCEDSTNSEQGKKSQQEEKEKALEHQLYEKSKGLSKGNVHVPMDEKSSENKTFDSEKIEIYPDVCDFPTEVLERSILAVENVLNTIDSMAHEFRNSTEVRDPLFVEVEALDTLEDLLEDTSMDQWLKKLTEDGLGDSNSNDVGKLQDMPVGDQLSKSRKYSSVLKKRLPQASIGSFTISKPTILCSGDSNSVQGTSRISHDSTKIKGNSFSDSLSQIDVLYLKPPVKNFLNSEENFPESVTSRYSVITRKSSNKEKQNNPKKSEYVASNDDEDVDPLMMALESLRTRVNAIEEEMVEVSPKLSCPKSNGAAIDGTLSCANGGKLCSERSRKRIPVREPLISKTFCDTSCRSLATSQSDNNFTLNHSYSVSCSSNGSRASSCRKCFIQPSPSSKVFPRASNRIFNTGRNRGNGSLAGSLRESNRRKPSKIFPDFYIDRCMKLLRKKFKDFDKLRRGKILDKKSDGSTRSYTFEEFEEGDVAEMVKSKIENRTTPKSKKSFYEKTEMLWINNTQENYKVCFKNEHFNNRSETSVESYGKEVASVAKKKNVYTISRIKSSP